MAVIGIIVFCGGIICAAAWLLNRPECEKESRAEKHGLVRGKNLVSYRRKKR